MPVYALLSLVVLSMVAVAAWHKRHLIWRRPVAYTLICLLLMTAVFDSIIVAQGIVAYDNSKLLGIAIGAAPIEDFAYTLAVVVIVPILWQASKHDKS